MAILQLLGQQELLAFLRIEFATELFFFRRRLEDDIGLDRAQCVAVGRLISLAQFLRYKSML